MFDARPMRIHSLITIIAMAMTFMISAGVPRAFGTPSTGEPPASAFTYQGLLRSNGQPLSGTADLRFVLFDQAGAGNQIGGTIEQLNLTIDSGTFTATLDFGEAAFDGGRRWLEIAVRAPAGSGSYVTLSPRQELTAVPYALRALNASIAGVQSQAVSFTNTANGFTGAALSIDGGTLHVDAASHRVGIGTLAPTHMLTIVSAADGDALRLAGPLGPSQFGARLSFGDGDHAYIEEDADNMLRLHASGGVTIASDLAGDAALTLPADSIAAGETLDEPGLAHLRQQGVNFSLFSAWNIIVTASIDCPAPGYVIATFSGTIEVGAAAGGNSVFIDIVPAGIGATPSGQQVTAPASTTFMNAASMHRVFAVNQPGAASFDLMARQTSGGAISRVRSPHITLLFVPTAYGSVDP